MDSVNQTTLETSANNLKKAEIIAVDLDGTLIRSDILWESIFLFLRKSPLNIFLIMIWCLKGKVFLKKSLADQVTPNVESLPYNRVLLSWLQTKSQQGATLVLASASDLRIVQRIADHLGIFQTVFGTEQINLSSENKRKLLVEHYGEQGYSYIGFEGRSLRVAICFNSIYCQSRVWCNSCSSKTL